ncbi:MAG: glycosyltransferase family 4 protein [Ectothiorhodospiraceae bacterium]|nr:glycosyltransferase family 4 protein [Chromatiales bacterium]MCP5156561.1 glycosyltransferase family 4 protein [Ectothiorhodospiraceae bacterium]
MKITQIMLSKGFGGGERYFLDLCLALAARGHQVQAVCHRRFERIGDLKGQRGIEVAAVDALGMWDVRSVRQMAAAAAEFAPAVMHSHMARGAWAGGKMGGRAGAPLVATTHNYVDLKYYGGVHTFIATTHDQAVYLADNRVAADRIVEIPNFSSFAPVAAAVRPGDPARFVAFGRFVTKKGFDVLLRALRKVCDAGVDARLALGGSGPEAAALESLARELGVWERVRFAGWVHDVAAFLREGEVFVLPSLDEPFGIVMLEAMASGRAIVTSRSQGPSEVLDDATCWFAELGDADTLARAMIEAARDPDAAESRATAALARYVGRYHEDVVVPRIEAVYASVVDASPGPDPARRRLHTVLPGLRRR